MGALVYRESPSTVSDHSPRPQHSCVLPPVVHEQHERDHVLEHCSFDYGGGGRCAQRRDGYASPSGDVHGGPHPDQHRAILLVLAPLAHAHLHP